MTTKKIIFAAALLAGTMTTSWASAVNPTVNASSILVFSQAPNIEGSFTAINSSNCATYTHDYTGGSVKVRFDVSHNYALNAAKVTVDYDGQMTGDGDTLVYKVYPATGTTAIPTGGSQLALAPSTSPLEFTLRLGIEEQNVCLFRQGAKEGTITITLGEV
jgi:hypothetical protein